jgi:hypothetical protein
MLYQMVVPAQKGLLALIVVPKQRIIPHLPVVQAPITFLMFQAAAQIQPAQCRPAQCRKQPTLNAACLVAPKVFLKNENVKEPNIKILGV